MLIQYKGEIIDGAAYSLAEFSTRTGLKRDAIRSARKNGLQVIRQHGRVFILGKEWLRYLNECLAKSNEDSQGGGK